jgi:hypothetical protein
LVSIVPKAIILLGPLSSTVEDEEKEAARLEIEACGVAITEKISMPPKDCSKLEVHPNRFSFCIDGVGICERERFCPFANKPKPGLPGGRLDLYCRSEKMCLLAVPKKEGILGGLEYIAFI